MGAEAPAPGAQQTGAAPLTVLDLFAGAGGFSAGFERTGRFRTVQAVEFDAAAAKTFELNHPRARMFAGPIEDWLKSEEPRDADVVIGGPPCQGFSTLNRSDVQPERNELWNEYVDAIVKVRPTYFVVENVAAFRRSPQFQLLVAEFESGKRLADYDYKVDVLNAAEYGSFQARKRTVLIGHVATVPFPGWPEKTRTKENFRTVREAFEGISDEWDYLDLPERPTLVQGKDIPGPYRTSELHVGRYYEPRSLERIGYIREGGNRFQIPDRLLSPCWRAHKTGSADVMGRLHWDAPSVTIRTEFFKPEKGRYLHPRAHRALTHLEAALLQGFPPDYKWAGSKVQIARQIGNAVPLELGEAIASQLLRAHAEVARAAGLDTHLASQREPVTADAAA